MKHSCNDHEMGTDSEKYSLIFQLLPDAVSLTRASDGILLDSNEAFEQLTGYGREEIVGRTAAQLGCWLDPAQWREVFRDLEATEKVCDLDTRIQRKDGRVVNVRIKVRRLDIEAEPYYLATCCDVTERDQAEDKAIKQREELRAKIECLLFPDMDISGEDVRRIIDFQAIQEVMNSFYKLTKIAMAIVDLKGNILVATGWQEICTNFHRLHPQTLANCIESDVYLAQNAEVGSYTLYKCKNNMWDMATPITVGGRYVASLFIGQFFFEDEVLDREVFARQAEVCGFDKEEYLAALERVPRWSRETFHNAMEFYTHFARMVAEVSYRNIRLARELIERKRAEEALRASEERFRQMFEQNDDAIILFDHQNCTIIDLNGAALKLFGFVREELIDSGNALFVEPAERRSFVEMVCGIDKAGGLRIDGINVVRKDGTPLITAIRGKLITLRRRAVVYCSFRDITEKIRLEKEAKVAQAKLLQADKMSSLGLLVTGMAHEINNPNNFITFNSALLAEAWQSAMPILDEYNRENGDFALGDFRFSEAREIVPRLFSGLLDGSRRIRDIVCKLKDFARQDTGNIHDPIDINKLMRDAVAIIDHVIKNHCENFHLATGCDLPPAMGNTQQIEQVIINLLMNALQALPDKKRGIRVAAGVMEDREHIVITVKDEGIGMPPEVLERLTEPFFTTKSNCGGTGLGLSISASILRENQGKLSFASEPGTGTTATVMLRIFR